MENYTMIKELPKWEETRELGNKEIYEMALDKIAEVYRTINVGVNFIEEYLVKRLEKASGWDRKYYLFAKFFYFLADDIRVAQMVNPDTWHMTTEEVDKYVEKIDYTTDFKKYKGTEDFPFECVEVFKTEMNGWYYEYCVDNVFDKLKSEIERLNNRI